MPDTETLDRLFLELSQFTQVTTGKELRLIKAIEQIAAIAQSDKHKNPLGDILTICERAGVTLEFRTAE